MFSSSSFKLLGLTFSSFIHFELIFVQGKKYVDIQFSQQHLLKRVCFLQMYVFGSFVKSQMTEFK
jgi:hypothetical protein